MRGMITARGVSLQMAFSCAICGIQTRSRALKNSVRLLLVGKLIIDFVNSGSYSKRYSTVLASWHVISATAHI